ncbi:dynamin family protein [Acinetobacter sp. Marseille-Q1623]|uniref:dynamin family protein n=1 Tax=Acinetobacter sp. Marseille-Q1623 TaxID=2697501 RepID=UPI00157AC41B|nr:dynamin family protein [Acinetobacter sp. Marseille-Q1623]
MQKNIALLNGLKQQLQKVLFNQQQLLGELEKNYLVPEHDATKPLVLDSKSVPEMKSVLQGEYIKLEKFEVVLAVVGTMKAGKSTTINAIVGREILPNRNRPMTSLPTLIAHVKGQKEPILSCDVSSINEYIAKLKVLNFVQYAEDERVSSYQEILELIQNIQAGYKFKESYKGEAAIFSFLAHLNDLVRLSRIIVEDYPECGFPFSAYKEINALPRIEVEFTELAQQEEHLGNLVLLDTPGPNEANLPELKEIFAQQLKRSSAVMVVMDYTQLKSQADADIREELEKLPKIEKDRLFALVNKFDQKNANGDDQATTKNIVANDLLKGKIHAENIYCISAQDAFLATRIQNYIALNQNKPSFDELEWVQDFAKKAFGTRAKRIWESSELDEVIEDSQALTENSLMALPLANIIQESYKNAPKIAMQSALKDVNYIFTEIKNVFSIQGRFSEAVELNELELQNIRQTINQLELDIQELKKNTEISKSDLEDISNQSVDEFASLFSLMEDKCADQIWIGMVQSIRNFKNQKEEEIQDIKFYKLDMDYYKNKNTLKKEISDLEKALEDEYGATGKIKLREEQMKKLQNSIAATMGEVNNALEDDIKSDLKQMSSEINHKIQDISRKNLEDLRRIQDVFGKEKIDIQFSRLNMANIEFSSSIDINLMNVSSKSKEEFWVTTGKIRKFFGGIFGTNWGQEKQVETYCEFTLPQLKKILKDLSVSKVLIPLKKQVTDNLLHFMQQMEDDAENIEMQADKLINELKAALEAEKMPYEIKQKRKESLRLIGFENQNIQNDIAMIENNLSQVLGDVA